jgi:hypothetical protein
MLPKKSFFGQSGPPSPFLALAAVVHAAPLPLLALAVVEIKDVAIQRATLSDLGPVNVEKPFDGQ